VSPVTIPGSKCKHRKKKQKTCGFSAGGFLNFWSSKLGNTPKFQGFPNGTGGLLALHGGVVLSLARGMGCGLGESP